MVYGEDYQLDVRLIKSQDRIVITSRARCIFCTVLKSQFLDPGHLSDQAIKSSLHRLKSSTLRNSNSQAVGFSKIHV